MYCSTLFSGTSCSKSTWYVVIVFLPVSILFMGILIAVYIYFFTDCNIGDLCKKTSDISQEQNLLNARNDGRPQLMSRFLSQDDLQKVYMLPEYIPRKLDLTKEERDVLRIASKIRCSRSDQQETEDFVNFIDTIKIAHPKKLD